MSGIKGLDNHSYISVIGCALEYRYIEVMHSSFQILIAVSASLGPEIPQFLSRCSLVLVFLFPGTEVGLYFPPFFVLPECRSLCKFCVLFDCSPVLPLAKIQLGTAGNGYQQPAG